MYFFIRENITHPFVTYTAVDFILYKTTARHYKFDLVQSVVLFVYRYILKGACSDPQPHPPNFFQPYGDFGTRI